jgi:hypothetical protein
VVVVLRVLACLLFPPLLEAAVLEEAKGDHGHERVAVQAGPSAASRPADPSLQG